MNETYGVLALGALAATATDVLSSADVLTSGGKLKQDTVSLLCPGASGRRDQATLLGWQQWEVGRRQGGDGGAC